MDRIPASDIDSESRQGEELAEITNGIVGLFAEYYGRGPTRAKTYLLDDAFVVTVLRDTMTTVEHTLAEGRPRRTGPQRPPHVPGGDGGVVQGRGREGTRPQAWPPTTASC